MDLEKSGITDKVTVNHVTMAAVSVIFIVMHNCSSTFWRIFLLDSIQEAALLSQSEGKSLFYPCSSLMNISVD